MQLFGDEDAGDFCMSCCMANVRTVQVKLTGTPTKPTQWGIDKIAKVAIEVVNGLELDLGNEQVSR